MAPLTETQRIEVLIMVGYGDRTRTQQEVCNLFNIKYPNTPITQSTVSKIEKKFRETGHVKHVANAGRPKMNDNVKLDVLLSVAENHQINSRQIAADKDISKTSVLRLLKKEKYHPYKIHNVQEINEDDPDRRMQFCEVMQDLCNQNPRFIRQILFSDEATFCLNGKVNRQNCRYWSTANPHWMTEAHTQYPQKVNVWAGIVEDRIIGPFFFDEPLTGQRYLDFLENELIPALTEIFPNENDPNLLNEHIWFQQDGAPPHFARPVRDFLNRCFPRRWIGRRGTIEWPPRSPDLTPLDFFLWGYLKSKVYIDRPQNLEDLKHRIRLEIRNITPEMIHNVQEECCRRFNYCQEAQGWQFEHLI